jgi:pyruvate-formate lyase-activating enzyme
MGLDPRSLTWQQKAQIRLRDARRKALGPAKWLAYATGQTRRVPYPDRLYIESTNICNLRCVMCPQGRGQLQRAKGHMDFGLFTRIVDEMAPHVETTTLHIWGEPLLYPRIADMIRYCAQHGLRCSISTNATLLDEDMGRRILEAGLDVIFLCLDGLQPQTYEAIRRNADFERTTANIRRFLDMKVQGSYRTWVNLQVIEMQQTLPEWQEFQRQWSLPGVDRIQLKALDTWGGQIEEVSQLRAAESPLPQPRWPCPNLWYHAHIYWDGTIAMCDRDFNLDRPLGHVRDGVMRGWNGTAMQELRRLHVRNDLEGVHPCDTCREWAWWKPSLFASHGNAPQRK